MRTISPQIFMDEFIGAQSLRLRLLWLGLIINLADDQGRLLDNPTIIRARIFPYDVRIKIDDIKKDLHMLAKAHKIICYRAGNNGDGKPLIQIVQWWKYQSKAQWAMRSLHVPPSKWVDRIRCHERGHGQDVVTLNWDHPGGFMKPLPKRLASQLPSGIGYPLASREEEEEDDERGKGRDKEPTPPPTPSPQERAGGRAGLDKKSIQSVDQLKGQQRKSAEQIAAILQVAGLSEMKIKTISVTMAMRSYKGNKIDYVLSAFASAYGDKKAERPDALACYRIEHDKVPKQYFNPDTWDKIPVDIVAAAGIKDLRQYTAEIKMNKFLRGDDYDRKVADLRKRSRER